MKRSTRFISLIAAAAGAGAAYADGGPQGPGGPGGPKGPGPAPAPGMLLAGAADADRSHDVTADEWSAFLASLNADENGAVDMTALAAALPPAPADAPADGLVRLLDVDQDGVVTLGDLNAVFARMDRNGDGALSSDDAPEGGEGGEGGPKGPPQGGPGGQGGQGGPGGPAGHGGGHKPPPPCDAKNGAKLLARAADSDESHDVSSDEWTAFLAVVDSDGDGVVDLDALAAALPAPPHGAGPSGDKLVRLFDQDQDGTVTTTDLAAVFALLDPNGDGAASEGEVKSQMRRPMRGGAKKGVMGLLRAADADDDKSVSAEEWAAFLDGIATDESGAVSLDDLATAIHAPAPKDGDATKRDAMLTKVFDADGDGAVTKADLQAVFNFFDRNADGAVDRSEVRPHK